MRVLRFEGKQALEDRLQYITQNAKSKLGRALETAAAIVETEAKRNAKAGRPDHQEVGHGDLSTRITHYLDPGKFRAYIGSNLRYAPMQEYGTAGLPGGVLRPKTKKYLRFFLTEEQLGGFQHISFRTNKLTGQRVSKRKFGPGKLQELGRGRWIYAKQVKIPARPFLGPALTAKQGEVRREIEGALSDLLAGR